MTYTRGEVSIGIGMLPGSKRPSLYLGNKYCIHKVASFSSEEAAEEATAYLEYFFNLREKPDGGDHDAVD